MKRMTDRQYVKAEGGKCPFCRSRQIEGSSVDIDTGGASQEMSCLDCGKQWVDCYELTGYIPKEQG